MIKYVFPLALSALSAGVGAQNRISYTEALTLAQEHRPAVHAAKLRLERAAFATRALGAYPATRFSTGGYNSDPQITQPIDVFGRVRTGRRLGEAGELKAEAELRQTLLTLQDEVLTQYGEAVAASRLALVAREQAEIAQRLLDAAKKRVEAGETPGVQVTRAQIEVERTKQRVGVREAARLAALRRLSGAVGEEIAEVGDFPMLTSPISVGDRADLMLLKTGIREAEAQAAIARVSNSPEVELQGRVTPWNPAESGFGVRLQLSLPIFDGNRAKNERRAAEREAEAQREQLRDATARAESELRAAEIEVKSANDQLASYAALLEDTRTLIRRSQAGFAEGATTLIEVLEAQRALREVEEGEVEARQRLVTAQIAVLRAAGGLL